MENTKSIGLVLSGGGVRGLAHVGLLEALEEHGIRPSKISGSSAGAMVGTLFAVGHSPKDIREFFKTNAHIFDWKHFTFRKPGFMDAQKYAKTFEPWLKENTFETLPYELYICVTDVLRGKVEYISQGELMQPLLASAAVPGVFSPVEMGESWYIDGGTMDNFPVPPLNNSDILLGSFVSPKKTIAKEDLNNTWKLLNRAKDLAFLAGPTRSFDQCDMVFVAPRLSQVSTFDLKKMDETYEIGYQNACNRMEELLRLIEEKNKSQPDEKIIIQKNLNL